MRPRAPSSTRPSSPAGCSCAAAWSTTRTRSAPAPSSAPADSASPTSRRSEAALGEDLADAGLEVFERQRVVVGVERDLVPLVGELLGDRVPRLVAVLVARVRVGPEVRVVVAALEVLVGADDV